MITFVILAVLSFWIYRARARRRAARRATEAMDIWSRIYYQLSARLPEAWGSSGPASDIDDAFVILYEVKKLMGAA